MKWNRPRVDTGR